MATTAPNEQMTMSTTQPSLSSETSPPPVDDDVPPINLEADSDVPAISLDDPPLPENEVAPTRSRPRTRRRSRHRHRPHRWRSRFQFKRKESNFPAAICSMIVVVLLCTAMAEPKWFHLKGGGCREKASGKFVHYLGLSQFFSMRSYDETFTNCITPRALQVIQSILALTCLGVLFSMFAFMLDLNGPTFRALRTVQRGAVLSMCTVAVCVTISGFSYWVTQILYKLQLDTKTNPGNKVEVDFSVSFYLVAAAGGMSVVAAACNLLRRHPPLDIDREHLLDNEQYMGLGLPADPYGPMGFITPPPPPPYSP